MSKQVMVTLDQIKKHEPNYSMWEVLTSIRGKDENALHKPFPLSSILDSNGLEDTLWCFRWVSKDNDVSTRFLLFCIKDIKKYSNDKQTHYYVNVLNKYLLKIITLRELRKATGTLRNTINSNATRAIAYTVFYISNPSYNNIYTAAQAVMFTVAQAAVRSTTKNTKDAHRNAYKAEEQRQIDYLRKLLDGEKV